MNKLLNQRLYSVNLYDKLLQKLKINIYKYSTAVKIKDEEKDDKEIMKEYEGISNISLKIKTKKPQRPPFAKNLFLGVYDTEILTYPQLEKDEMEKLDKQIKPVMDYFEKLPLEQTQSSLADDFFENLKRLRLFGLQASQLLNAFELNVTEHCRFNDVICNSTSSASTLLYNNTLGIQAFIKKGNEEQKKKYLPNLVAGNKLVGFSILEPNTKDITSFNTTATLSQDKKQWTLNGEKSWVINGNLAELLVVIAQTEHLNRVGIKEDKLTAFIVEKDFPGVTTHSCQPLGIKGTDMCNIKFNNTPVPVENVLGEVNAADSVMACLLNEFRLNTGVACSALSRKLLGELVNYCTRTNYGSNSITEADYIRSGVAEITTMTYAIESAIYLTAGLLDQYVNQDCEMESAIVKVFSSEQTHRSILKTMELIGPAAYMTDHWCNVLLRDGLSHLILNEPNENLKLSIALLGLRHAGLELQDRIRVMRNPLFHPSETLKRMWLQRRQVEDNPPLTLSLGNYLHPSLIEASKSLEYCVLRLQFATEMVLARYGSEVINAHMELKRLAECVIDIYVMTACLGRASRSYCIGLQHADYEMILASTYCYSAMGRVKETVKKLTDGPYLTTDESYRKIAGKTFKAGKYFPVHPLTRNF